MKRRAFLTLFGSVAVGWPLNASGAQKRTVPIVGVIYPGFNNQPGTDGFYKGLQDLGYAEGLNIAVERRFGEWKPERFVQLATEMVRLEVDVIVVMSTSPAHAVKQSTRTIPIAVGGMADPVEDELVASLSQPGGNITGNTFLGPELILKRMSLLNAIVPRISRVVALFHPSAYGKRTMDGMLKETATAAQLLRLELDFVPANQPSDLDGAFVRMLQADAGAAIQLPSPMLFGAHRQIVEAAKQFRLPFIYAAREFVEKGGLMSYGASQFDMFYRLATYVDKILRGYRPAELPVEQPTKLEFVVNLQASKDLGLTIGNEYLSMADEVIE
ncbi:ABC transporter substrate-binding protein [Prosthecomicrobium sp. N25]|uniref:ABC transporter substrate-binding protein n=1 Tax=Prosthecomicrobium sp. N25 TaxID=3129254 RepID=UPI0030780CC2